MPFIDGGNIEYALQNATDNDTIWQAFPKGVPVVSLALQHNSAYNFLLRYNFQPGNISSYSFTVQPYWWQTNLFKIIIGAAIVSLLFFIPFFIYRKNKQQQLLTSNFKKTQQQLELKAIHAQLNPHFIFNALNSIQSLINQNKIDNANHYLTEFSSLLRQSLGNAEKEMIPLAEEINALEHYLNLEQLRFNFTYNITVAPEIKTSATEIPALLLQPIIENAVKHGISHLQKKGNVAVNFVMDEQDMIATITDNGKGFDTAETFSGHGLRLTEERITLLNQLLKTPTISCSTDSNINGTVVLLRFKNWQQ
ncbi:sensor histidine kinase [Ferruginibacter sp.]